MLGTPLPFVGQNADVDTAAEQITATSRPLSYGIVLIAHPSNTAAVYWGLSDAITTSTGCILPPGVPVAIDVAFAANADDIYVIAASNNQAISFYGV